MNYFPSAELLSVLFLTLSLHSVYSLSSQFHQHNSNKKPCFTNSPNYEVHAFLVPCHPNRHRHRCTCGQSGKLQGFSSNLCEPGKIKDCINKLVISVKMVNKGRTNRKQYVVVEEVYDCQTDTKQKLLYPYVVKLKQEPLLQTYRLDYENSVKEGCRALEGMTDDRKRKLKKKPWMQRIPWVEFHNNFTHAIRNIKRGTGPFREKYIRFRNQSVNSNPHNPNVYSRVYPYPKPSYDNTPKQCVNHGRRFEDNLKKLYEKFRQLKNGRGEKFSLDNNIPFGLEGQRVAPSSLQFSMRPPPNEGWNNSNDEHPPKKHPAVEIPKSCCHENCDMRYYIYKLQEPTVKHHFSIEIFEKHFDVSGAVHWNTITDKPIFLGTYDTQFRTENGGLAAIYSSREPPLQNFAIAFDCMKLLIPQFSYLRGGPARFLLIPQNMFVKKTKDFFDFSGVNYGAHEKCITKNRALKYPPKWFWCQDRKQEQLGYRGNFFLKYFAKLPPTPLHNTTDCFQNLTFFYEGPHHSFLNIEIRADLNMMLKPHISAVITEVYVDATHYEKTDITVKVTNTGLVYAAFYVFLTDCPLSLPAGFSNIATSSAVIPPQQQHVFTVTVLYPLPTRKFYCSVDVKNYRHEILAFRRIRFQKSDRCICIWHCCCTCLETDKGLKCHPLPIDHYNAAGFYGGLPIASNYIMATSFVEEYLLLMFNLCLTMTILLLLMGVCKAFLGLCYAPIGRFGLEWYLGLPKSIDRYYESNLRMRPVQYDKLGWPIHPETKKRCRTTSISTEFTINVVFFLLYPLVLFHAIVVKVCTPEYVNDKPDHTVNNRKGRRRSCPLTSAPPRSCMKRCK